MAEFTDDPAKLTLAQIKEVLAYARDQLGLTDIYNSDHAFIAANMTPIGNGGINHYGSYKRDARDLVNAVYVVGDAKFEGSSAAAGGEQSLKGGALVIKDKNGEIRAISREKAIETYMLPNGKSLENRFEVAEMDAALAQSPQEFGTELGQVPIKQADGTITSTELSSYIVAPNAQRKPVQGKSTEWTARTRKESGAERG